MDFRMLFANLMRYFFEILSRSSEEMVFQIAPVSEERTNSYPARHAAFRTFSMTRMLDDFSKAMGSKSRYIVGQADGCHDIR